MSIVAGAVVAMLAPAAQGAEPGTAPVPASVRALAGCWQGQGKVMAKPVSIRIDARPITLGALFLVEAESQAVADPTDQYAAHLIFGGGVAQPAGDGAASITGFWADSFGGAYTATGSGESRTDGFDITYRYPDAAFVNRWRLAGDRVEWSIVARDGKGKETPFASYTLRKATCAGNVVPG